MACLEHGSHWGGHGDKSPAPGRIQSGRFLTRSCRSCSEDVVHIGIQGSRGASRQLDTPIQSNLTHRVFREADQRARQDDARVLHSPALGSGPGGGLGRHPAAPLPLQQPRHRAGKSNIHRICESFGLDGRCKHDSAMPLSLGSARGLEQRRCKRNVPHSSCGVQGKTVVHTCTSLALVALISPLWDVYRLASETSQPSTVADAGVNIHVRRVCRRRGCWSLCTALRNVSWGPAPHGTLRFFSWVHVRPCPKCLPLASGS